jgi:hypothetical protein
MKDKYASKNDKPYRLQGFDLIFQNRAKAESYKEAE